MAGANCKLMNDKGAWFIDTPGSTTIRRSYEDLGVRCEKESHEPGTALVKSATKGMAYGNLLFGGVIGAGVDIGTGAAFDYPPLVTVVMGQTSAIGSPPSSPAKSPADIAQERINAAQVAPVVPATPPVALPVAALLTLKPVAAVLLLAPQPVHPVQVVSPPGATVVVIAALPAPKRNGYAAKFSLEAMHVPEVRACNPSPQVTLTDIGPGFESYTAACTNGDALAVRCEFGTCRVLK